MKHIFYLFLLLFCNCKAVNQEFQLKVYLDKKTNKSASIEFKKQTSATIMEFEKSFDIDLCKNSNFRGVLTNNITNNTDVIIYFRKDCLNKSYTVFHNIITIDLNDQNILIQNTYENHLIDNREKVIKKLISIIEEESKKKNSFLINWTSQTDISSYYFLLQILNEVFNEFNTNRNIDYIPNIILSDSFSPPPPPEK